MRDSAVCDSWRWIFDFEKMTFLDIFDMQIINLCIFPNKRTRSMMKISLRNHICNKVGFDDKLIPYCRGHIDLDTHGGYIYMYIIYYYASPYPPLPPQPLCHVVGIPAGPFFPIKWRLWKFPTCILSKLMFLINIWIIFGQCLSSRWVSRSICLL